MLFRKDTLERIARCEVTLAFRRWKRPTVRAGGTLQTRVGVLSIASVDPLAGDEEISDADAIAAGFANRRALISAFPPRPDTTLYRVRFALTGPDPRIALRERAELDEAEADEIARRLARLDAHAPRGPWTRSTLQAIADRPATRAADLATDLGEERLPFKANVRKLKALGLTESLEVGYRLSPRGRAFLARTPV